MIKVLIRRFINNSEEISNGKVRNDYSLLSGVLGIICNLSLFILKIVLGLIMNSISILSDGINNLSDIGTSVIAVVSAKTSDSKPDRDHPFGHGRIEYILTLIVSFILLLIGKEVFKSSVIKIFKPEPIVFSWILVGVLSASLLVKVWMYSYNTYMGDKINSILLLAVAKDSMSDILVTGGIIVSAIVGHFTGFNIDGYAGALVSISIMYTGYKIAKEAIFTLLGTLPPEETFNKVEEIVLAGEGVCGVHDLILHDYGPGRFMGSIHVEVSDEEDVVTIHERVDKVERNVKEELGIDIVIHIDPISTSCVDTQCIWEQVEYIGKIISKDISFHDFRIAKEGEIIEVYFDMVLPFEMEQDLQEEIIKEMKERLIAMDKRYKPIIQVDNQ